jgi:excisionase family DNA binding protein
VLTIREAARRTKRDPETVKRWIRSGRLRFSKVGKQQMIDESDLAQLAQAITLPLPAAWRRTATGEPMPDVLAAIGASRAGR